MTYTIILWPKGAWYEMNVRGMSEYTGKIVGTAQTITEARKKAMKELISNASIQTGYYGYAEIYNDSSAKYVIFGPTGQRLKSHEGEEVGRVRFDGEQTQTGHIGWSWYTFKSKSISEYKNSMGATARVGYMKWHIRALKSDGTLGKKLA